MSYEKEIDENSILFKLREEQEMKLKGGLYHQTQIRMAYNSNHMEGSRLTEDQTRSIYETRTIGVNDGYEKIDDIIETVNHFRCFDYILSIADKELSEDIIKHIQLPSYAWSKYNGSNRIRNDRSKRCCLRVP